jgi:hypothetical protein
MLFSTAGIMWHEILNDDHKGKNLDGDTPISKHCISIFEKTLQKCVIYNKLLGNPVKNNAGYVPNIQPLCVLLLFQPACRTIPPRKTTRSALQTELPNYTDNILISVSWFIKISNNDKCQGRVKY